MGHVPSALVAPLKAWFASACLLALACDAANPSPREVDAGPERQSDASVTASPDAGSDAASPIPGADAPSFATSFVASDEVLLNPERGFYTTTSLTLPGDLAYVREEGKTLVYASAHLDAYLGADHEQDLPAQLLSDVQAGFDAVRAAGLKAVVRFQYDDGAGYPDGANDASEAFMVRHIEQLAPLLKENEDVIFVLQAGLIGAWGEWHTSLNFIDGPDGKEPRQRVVEALLAALPESRRVALRYPAYKRMFFGTEATEWRDLEAGAASARAGHLNDCFVSSEDDVGTYQYEPIQTLRDYLEEDTRYVPIGGETCAVHERNACPSATAEMQAFHWTYLNEQYHPDVIARWTSEGCRPEIDRKLGYRLALSEATLPRAVRPGGSFSVDLTLVNEGWASVTNPRPVLLVLEGQGLRLSVALPTDVRAWLPGEHQVKARLRVPSDLPLGTYRLALWLPDAAENLRERPEYAIRLANEGLWVDEHGDHTLTALDVSTEAEGEAVAGAGDFALVR